MGLSAKAGCFACLSVSLPGFAYLTFVSAVLCQRCSLSALIFVNEAEHYDGQYNVDQAENQKEQPVFALNGIAK